MARAGATRTASRIASRVASRLGRLALHRQGLLQRAPFGRGLAGARRAIEQLGYVQIDTISVVSRAHDHVLQARVPGYRPDMLDRLQADGHVFEYWAHAAAYLPLRDYRFARPHMDAMRARQTRWVRSRDGRLMRRVLDRVRAEGPLQTRDFEAPAGRRSSGWWDWKPAKHALEQLFMQGDLMVVGRAGFQKIYDLPERVLPAEVDTSAPSLDDYARHLIERQSAAMGFATARACVYQRQTPGLREAVADALEAERAQGRLTAVSLPTPGGREETAYADPAALEGRAPPAQGRARVLSPFDNVMIRRQLARSLFGFDYQLECYVPAARRRFGYFCLPVLYRDHFVGRVDCKAHRRERRLEIIRLTVEHPERLPRDPAPACDAIAVALAELASHNACCDLDLHQVAPTHLHDPMVRAVHHANRERP
ncbi:MAG: crosslink repair DNA glycosylase YcaQ family protein [Pseudomonadales bacterium]